MHLVAIDTLALALHSLYVLLDRHHVLPRAICSDDERAYYSTDALRYELRMNPFIPITLPELVPYDQFRRSAALQGISDAVVLERATRAVAEARKAWETVLVTGPFLEDETKKKKGGNSTPTAIEEYWKKEVKDTIRACIGTSIAIGTVQKALNKKHNGGEEGRQRVLLDVVVDIPEVESKARWHPFWAVPRILEKKTVELR